MLIISNILKIVLGGIVGIVIYLFVAPITGAINTNDIKALKEILGSQPILGKIAYKMLTIMQFIAENTYNHFK